MENYERMAKLAVEKSLLKEYMTSDCPRTVYMKDKDEFQIQLFNPTGKVIGASVSINGDEIGGMIVLKPGERVWLERYINDAVKFRFETYSVEAGDADVREAIKGNGDVTVKFYREKEKERWRSIQPTISMYSDMSCPKPIHGNFQAPGMYSSECKLRSSCASAEPNMRFMSFIPELDDATEISSSVNQTLGMMETGRVGKGGCSDQDFNIVAVDFEYSPFYTADLKILPVSRKPVSSSDLQKIYCTQCGRKLNTKFKFCPYCGAEVVD